MFFLLEVFYNWHVIYLLMISSQQRYGTINVIIAHSWKCPTGFSTYLNLLQSEANHKKLQKEVKCGLNRCSYFWIENCNRNVINRKCHSMRNEKQSQSLFFFFPKNFLNLSPIILSTVPFIYFAHARQCFFLIILFMCRIKGYRKSINFISLDW